MARLPLAGTEPILKISLSRYPTAPITIGYTRLLDAAPFVVAAEKGFFAERGLPVELHRQLGWVGLEQKLENQELQAAQALGPLPLAMAMNSTGEAIPVVAPLVSSFLGNAITLSEEIRRRGVKTSDDLRREVQSRRNSRKYTFGFVSRHSSHHYLLRLWLSSIRIDPDKDVNLVVIPPGQALHNLKVGTLDGFCVGEPWNSFAIRQNIGWSPAWSNDIAPWHPEKVLAINNMWARRFPDLVDLLVDSLVEACTFCTLAENLGEVAKLLSGREYLGVPAPVLEASLANRIPKGTGELVGKSIIHFSRPDRDNLADPADIRWFIRCLEADPDSASSRTPLEKLATSVYVNPTRPTDCS